VTTTFGMVYAEILQVTQLSGHALGPNGFSSCLPVFLE
jgi:hypothetical protein